MAGFGDSVENWMLDWALRSVVPTLLTGGTVRKLSLHTGDPGESGLLNEVSGGTGPYARQNATFNAASGGSSALSAPVAFPGMPGVVVSHAGVWDTAGVFIGSGPLPGGSVTVLPGSTFTLSTGPFALD